MIGSRRFFCKDALASKRPVGSRRAATSINQSIDRCQLKPRRRSFAATQAKSAYRACAPRGLTTKLRLFNPGRWVKFRVDAVSNRPFRVKLTISLILTTSAQEYLP
jgi:hypothetical protein